VVTFVCKVKFWLTFSPSNCKAHCSSVTIMNVQPQHDPFRPVTNAHVTNDPNRTSDVSIDHRSVLDSSLPVYDEPVDDAQVCTGAMHVLALVTQQPVKNWIYANQGNLIAHNFNKIGFCVTNYYNLSRSFKDWLLYWHHHREPQVNAQLCEKNSS